MIAKIRILSITEELKRVQGKKGLHSSVTRYFSSHLSEETTKCKKKHLPSQDTLNYIILKFN